MTKTPDRKDDPTERCTESQTEQPQTVGPVVFDALARLARDNPEGYFQQRLHHVSEALANLYQTQQVELSGLQSMIDQMRVLSATPERAQIRKRPTRPHC